MKTIILYATKYGAAEETAGRIAEKINGAAAFNLKKGSIPSLADFECVIVGSGVYAGNILKEAKTFLAQNEKILSEKKLGLFLCGMGTEGETYFNSNFPASLLESAKAKSLLGGIFDPKKANAFERFIIKIVTKSSAYINTISERRIEQFAKAMQ
ncbi:MAG: flavodoxin domain-containing protein [Treponema sp.]|nr:flavodoxin domain-containing protein [Treponema sp.]